MTTPLRVIVDDLATSFRQITDDKNVQKSQIAYWVVVFGNRLKMQHIGKRDSGQHLSIYANIPFQTFDTVNNPNEVPGRKYIELPTSIFDYDKDGGIEYMSYYMTEQKPTCPPPFTNVTFSRTSPGDAKRLYMGPYEKPTPTNPYYYRVGSFLYTLGIECVNPDYAEIGIYSTLKPITAADFDLDANFDFPEELLPQLIKQVLDLGRFVMMMPVERTNDGADSVQQNIPTNKLVSVNEGREDIIDNK
jgi:hypothetical protein